MLSYLLFPTCCLKAHLTTTGSSSYTYRYNFKLMSFCDSMTIHVTTTAEALFFRPLLSHLFKGPRYKHPPYNVDLKIVTCTPNYSYHTILSPSRTILTTIMFKINIQSFIIIQSNNITL